MTTDPPCSHLSFHNPSVSLIYEGRDRVPLLLHLRCESCGLVVEYRREPVD